MKLTNYQIFWCLFPSVLFIIIGIIFTFMFKEPLFLLGIILGFNLSNEQYGIYFEEYIENKK